MERLDETEWVRQFVHAWMRLVNGNDDPHSVYDWAAELYRTNPQADPVKVARAELRVPEDAPKLDE